MHVGLDALFLLAGESGGRETYARELVANMAGREPGTTFTMFANRESSASLARDLGSEVRVLRLPLTARRAPEWAAGELALLPLAAARERVDVLHSLANFAPVAGRGCRVVTIHDLEYRALPELIPTGTRVATAIMVETAARRAQRIIAVSEAGRQELVRELRLDPARIDVVHNGVRLPPAPDAGATIDAAHAWRERLEVGDRRVVLVVSSHLPHKNLPMMLTAVADIEAAERPLLVLAGAGTDDEDLTARARTAGVQDGVRGIGALDRASLEAVYSLADCVAIPSLHEGFGLVALEAMARSVPVVCSDLPALREVAGSAAVFFDPHRPSEAAAALALVLGNRELAAQLREKGHAQAARFSWARAGAETLATYHRALTAHRSLRLGRIAGPNAQ